MISPAGFAHCAGQLELSRELDGHLQGLREYGGKFDESTHILQPGSSLAGLETELSRVRLLQAKAENGETYLRANSPEK